MTADPAPVPALTVTYDDGALHASWPVVPDAAAYRVEVASGGTTVLTQDVPAAGYAPPVALGLTPEPGTAYTVTVAVLGPPSAAVEVTPVNLATPGVTVTYAGAVATLAWAAVAGATGYAVEARLAGAGAGAGVVVASRAVDGTTATLGTADGLTTDTAYAVRVRATAGASLGPWSAPADVTLRSARAALTALSSRLVAARTASATAGSYDYPLDAATFGDDGARVLATWTAALGSPPAVTSAAEPALSPDGGTLTVAGTAAVPGAATVPVTLTFTAPAGAVEGTWEATPPRLADAFAGLAGTAFDTLGERDVRVVVTTLADPGAAEPLAAGANAYLTVDVRTSLLVSADGTEPDAHAVRLGGPATVVAGRPEFAWTSATLPDLTVARAGQGPLAVTGGVVSLGAARDDDTEDVVLRVAGRCALAGTPRDCLLDLPTPGRPLLTLSVQAPWVSDTATAALTTADVADVAATALPATLLALADASVTGWSLTFDPAGLDASRTTVAFGFAAGETWTLVGGPAGLSVEGVEATVTVARRAGYDGTTRTALGGSLTGTLVLGTGRYAVGAAVPPYGPWTFELSELPPLDALAGLAGSSSSGITSLLPGPVAAALGGITLTQAVVVADVTVPAVVAVGATVGQTAEVTFAGVTLSGWTVEVSLVRDGERWDVSGSVDGTIGAASGASFDVSLPFPIGSDALWEIGLADGSSVAVPTMGEVLAYLGAGPAALPDGLATLGGLDVATLRVWLDPAAVAVRQVAVGFTQRAGWSVAGGFVTVTGVDATLALAPGPPVRAAGTLGGTLTVAGTAVDLYAVKNGFDGTWTLYAAVTDPVHVPGFASLETWLSPSAAAAYLPAAPLRDGFTVQDVALAFDANGALCSIGFTAAADDVWTVLPPDRLALTDVRGTVAMPYPVDATRLTGSVLATVTVAGVDVLLSATKPDAGAPWTFAGSLAPGQTVDLVGAAGTVSDTLAPPADATSLGLPPLELVSANVLAVPDTGRFHVDGAVDAAWSFAFGPSSAPLTLTGLGGSVDVASSGATPEGSVYGDLTVAGLDARLTLAFGAAHTVLTGTVAPAAAASIDVGGLAGLGSAGTGGTWSSLAPRGLATLAFDGAAVSLDLTDGSFVVAGAMRYGDKPAASGLVLVDRADGAWAWAVAVRLGTGTGAGTGTAPAFRFGDLLPALAVVDAHLAVSDARLVVCDAGAETLGALATRVGAALAAAAPSLSSPLDGLAAETLALADGTWITATLDFTSPGLLSRVVQLGNGTAPASVRVAALVDAANPAATTFTADLPDVTLLGALLLTHDATHEGIHLTYRPDAASLTLEGRASLPALNLGFDVSIAVDDTGARADATQTAQSLPAPFGLPGVTVSGLGLALRYVWAQPGATPPVAASSSVALVGHATLGSDVTASFQASVVLVDARPALLDVTLDKELPILGFLTQFAGLTWPGDYVEVAIAAGSRVYYYDPTVAGETLRAWDGGSFAYDGLVADGQLCITLVTKVTVDGRLQRSTDSDGPYVAATASLTEPVDLVFASLAGTTQSGGAYVGGPGLTLRAGSAPALALETGVNFLGSAFLTASVSARTSTAGRVLSGTLTAARDLAPFGRLSCTFTHTTQADGTTTFAIQGWPEIIWVRDLVGFVDTMKSLYAAGGPCGALGDLVAGQFTPTFRLTPGVTSSGANLVFSLTGTYALAVGGGDPFVSVTFPPMDVAVPAATRWPDLPEALATGIASGAAKVVGDLLSRPQDAAMFLAMVFGPQAAGLAAKLACDGLVDAAVAAGAEAAATAAAAAGGTIAGAAAAAGAAIAGHHSGGGSSGHGGSTGHGGDPGTPGTPGLTGATYADGAVTATWNLSNYAAGYDVALTGPAQDLPATSLPLTATSVTLPVGASALPPGTYTVGVRATHGSTQSDWSTLSLTKNAAPAASLTYADGALSVSWTGGTAPFTVELTDPAAATTTTTSATATASFPAPDPAPGTYTARVRSADAGLPSGWGTSGTYDLALTLPAPAIGRVRYADGTVTVTWAAGAGAHDARARTGTTAVSSATAAEGATSVTLPPPRDGYAVGTTYTVEVRARTSGGLSPWASATLVPATPAPPTGVAATMTGTTLGVSWTPAAGQEATYEVTVADASGATVATASGAGEAVVPAFVAGAAGPAEGDVYAIAVRAVVGSSASAAAAATFPVHVLPPPSGVTFAVSGPVGSEVEVRWTAPVPPAAITAPLGYVVSLGDGPPIRTTSTFLTRKVFQVTDGGGVRTASVSAVAGPYASVEAASAPLTLPSPLSLAQAARAAAATPLTASNDIVVVFPGASVHDLTDALVTAYEMRDADTWVLPLAQAIHGYGSVPTITGELRRAFPAVTPAALARALVQACAAQLVTLVDELHSLGTSPADAARAVTGAYDPRPSATDLAPLLVRYWQADGPTVASSLVAASYPPAALVAGLHEAFAAQTSAQVAVEVNVATSYALPVPALATALVAGFGTVSPDDLVAALHSGYAQQTADLPPDSAARGVVAAIPGVDPTTLAVALAGTYASYRTADEILAALREVFPALTVDAAAVAIVTAYGYRGADPGTVLPTVDVLHTMGDPDVVARAVSTALALPSVNGASALAQSLRSAYGIPASGDGEVAFALREAGFALTDVADALDPASRPLANDVWTSSWWVAAATARTAGRDAAAGATAVRAAAPEATREQVAAAVVGAWCLADPGSGLATAAAAMKAAGFSLEDAAFGLKSAYGSSWNAGSSYGVVLNVYSGSGT